MTPPGFATTNRESTPPKRLVAQVCADQPFARRDRDARGRAGISYTRPCTKFSRCAPPSFRPSLGAPYRRLLDEPAWRDAPIASGFKQREPFEGEPGTEITEAFSTKLVANALMQYNKLDDELSISVRINFIHRPGSDLFIVINEERGSSTSIWDVNTRAAVVKLTYLARL